MSHRPPILPVALAVALVVGLGAASPARAVEWVFEGTTRYVAQGVAADPADTGCDHPQFSTLDYDNDHDDTIQAAIEASSDGDTVHICAGTWTLVEDPDDRDARGQAVDLLNTNSKSLSFVGEGREVTILDADPFDGDDRYRIISSADNGGENWEPLSFADMTIQDGYADWHGGAVVAEGVRCERVDFVNNETNPVLPADGRGGAIYSDGDVYLDDCGFYDNVAETHGGAVGVVNGDVEILNGSVFENNSAGDAAGALWAFQDAVEAGTLSIEDATFLDNDAGGDMGAVGFYNYSEVLVNDVQFSGNQTGAGDSFKGGALGGSAGNIAVHNSEFVGNFGDYSGGAITVFKTDFGLQAELLVDGGSVFEANEAMIGGAIYAEDSHVTVRGTRFGSATDGGSCDDGDSEFGNLAINGGALNVYSDTLQSSLDVRSSTFFSNCAVNFAPGDGSGQGGAIYVGGDEDLGYDLRLEASRFESNGADADGGAIFAAVVPVRAPLSLLRNTFVDNVAGLDDAWGQGGAVRIWFANRDTEISGNEFSRNSADQGGALSMNDGIGDDPLAYRWALTGNYFRGNTATQNGGALHMALDNSGAVSPTRVHRNTFAGNSAPVGGAVVVESDVGGANVIQRRFTRALAENRFRGNRATESRRTANIGVHFDE
jgi:hypothetical protein